MLWKKMSFETALLRLWEAFEDVPEAARLAMVWREGGEYNILPTWLIPHFREFLDWQTLVVVMCLDRKEAEDLKHLIVKEEK